MKKRKIKNDNKFWINYHKKRIARLKKTKYMRPPWVVFPTYEPGCLGWRMGDGEYYMWDFQDWFKALPPERKERYVKKNPPPEEWQKFYEKYNGFYFMISLVDIDANTYWKNKLSIYVKPYLKK